MDGGRVARRETLRERLVEPLVDVHVLPPSLHARISWVEVCV
jgi:hypothetical protein